MAKATAPPRKPESAQPPPPAAPPVVPPLTPNDPAGRWALAHAIISRPRDWLTPPPEDTDFDDLLRLWNHVSSGRDRNLVMGLREVLAVLWASKVDGGPTARD